MGTTGKLLGAVYDLSANKLMGLAVKIKERPDWCQQNIANFPQVRYALEKVLDIRADDRERVYRYYHSTSRYPKVQTERDLRQAYEFQRMIRQDGEHHSDALTISLKRAIREYTNRSIDWVRIVKDDGMDGYIELRKMPRFDSLEEADEWFKNCYYLEAQPSAYDCTGQRFTVWYKLFQRHGRWWAYHRVGVDV